MVADAVWYPKMDASDPASCALAMVTAFNPVQLIDSLDGHVRASYLCPSVVSCLLFSGGSILAGGARSLYSCDIVRNGSKGEMIVKCRGSVTALVGDESHTAIGLGLSTGMVQFVDLRSHKVVAELGYHRHAVDAIVWDDRSFFTSAKLEGTVFGFDLRSPGIPECSVLTGRKTSRLVGMSLCGQWLGLGNEDGPGSIFRRDGIGEDPERVGVGPTPLVALAPGTGKIAVASGCHTIVPNEEDDSDISFEPRLVRFEVLPPMATNNGV
jgi:hypothetical protein